MYQELSKSWKYLEANEALGSLHSNWRRQTRDLGSGYTIHIRQFRVLDKQLHVFLFPSRFYLKLPSLETSLGWFGSLRLPAHAVAMLWVQQGVPGLERSCCVLIISRSVGAATAAFLSAQAAWVQFLCYSWSRRGRSASCESRWDAEIPGRVSTTSSPQPSTH